jgi:hypothetical protein
MKLLVVPLLIAFLSACSQKAPTTEDVISSPSSPRSSNSDKDEPHDWYILQNSMRLSDDGKRTNECVKFDHTPAWVIEAANSNGWPYTLDEDTKASTGASPQIVWIIVHTPKGKVSYFLTREKRTCLATQNSFGVEVTDPSRYE